MRFGPSVLAVGLLVSGAVAQSPIAVVCKGVGTVKVAVKAAAYSIEGAYNATLGSDPKAAEGAKDQFKAALQSLTKSLQSGASVVTTAAKSAAAQQLSTTTVNAMSNLREAVSDVLSIVVTMTASVNSITKDLVRFSNSTSTQALISSLQAELDAAEAALAPFVKPVLDFGNAVATATGNKSEPFFKNIQLVEIFAQKTLATFKQPELKLGV